MVKLKNIISRWKEDMGELELFCNVDVSAKWDNQFAKAFGRFVVKYAVITIHLFCSYTFTEQE